MNELTSLFESVVPSAPPEPIRVPNEFPALDTCSRIAIIGEAPGEDEVTERRPFVGMSGKLLTGLMSKAGLSRQSCFIGNICQQRPPDNKINEFAWNGPEMTDGLTRLTADLQKWRPNVVLLLGATAFYAATGDWKRKPTDWRGSLFTCTLVGSPFFGMKCLCSIHPAAVLRQLKRDDKPADTAEQGAWLQLLYFDLVRAKEEGQSPELHLPERHIDVSCNFTTILTQLERFHIAKPTLSIDIEGGLNSWTSISLAWSPHDAIVIPFTKADGTRFWSEDQEVLLFPALSAVLADTAIPKILQNCLYDAFVLAYGYKILIRNIRDDTMLKFWELLCELPKNLGLQASILTREPYWKHEITGDFNTFLLYNGKDACVTYEISEALDKQLSPAAKQHYNFNVSLLPVLLYTEVQGMGYDKAKAHEMLTAVSEQVYTRQHALNIIAGCSLTPHDDFLKLIKEKMCYKKLIAYSYDNLLTMPKKEFTTTIYRAVDLAKKAESLSDTELGELETLLEVGINVDSPPQLCTFLYRKCGYSPQYKKVGGRLTDKETADELALLKLYVKHKQDKLIYDILVLKKLITSTETLAARTDNDNRIRCGYNIVGADTGRMACYSSPTGSGYNLQTVTRKHRILFPADPGYYFFECDLSGADGWTVAAIMAQLGDRTMLDDYNFGLKPANIIAQMYEHGAEVNTYSREELKARSKLVDAKGWLYFACKRVQHGTSYGMGPNTLSDQLLKDSYKLSGIPVYVEPEKTKRIQNLFHHRYRGISQYQKWIADELKVKGSLTAASGSKRLFLGKRDDYDTIKSAFSHLPQHHTTYATMLAIRNCWYDPENRNGNNLIIKPAHQVHDAFCGQFPIDRVDWAREKIRAYFNNTLNIMGLPLVIPFEGGYGPSWNGSKYPYEL